MVDPRQWFHSWLHLLVNSLALCSAVSSRILVRETYIYVLMETKGIPLKFGLTLNSLRQMCETPLKDTCHMKPPIVNDLFVRDSYGNIDQESRLIRTKIDFCFRNTKTNQNLRMNSRASSNSPKDPIDSVHCSGLL